MTILLAVTLAAAIQPSCSWDRPGQNPYKGSTEAAIDHYQDIPANVRSTLKARMQEGLSDDKVDISRDGITGKNQYSPEIRDMHFGSASVCGSVTRSKWAADRIEPAAVYCVGEHCILVPKICGNVSRISRLAPAPLASTAVTQPKPRPQGIKEYTDISLRDAPPMELVIGEPGDYWPRRMLATAGGGWPEIAQQPPRPFPYGYGRPPAPIEETAIPAPVPEPETWAMLLGGLGLVGWMARRRGRAA